MPGAGVADVPRTEIQHTPAKCSTFLTKLARGFWLPFRRFIAELRAFPVTLTRGDESLIVKAHLPGLQKDEVRVEISEDMLVIDAEPKRDSDGPCFRTGRRLIPLPDDAEIGPAKAELKNGILVVFLPIRHVRKMDRQVPVECAEDSAFDIEPLEKSDEHSLPLV